jgi:Effector Associated Constant Component 1
VGTAGEMVIQLGIGEHGDAERLAEATYLLQRELGGLDLEAVRVPPAGRPPAGAKGVDVGAIGTLVVTLGQQAQLGAVVSALLDWALRDRHRRVRVELDGDVLEVDGLSARDQRRIVDHWLRRHPGR